ncbi:P17 [Indian peanut clump virus]|uniref:p17 n=1 Tax=Indian peanut clump virus TaxID=32629 RepID=Q8B0Z4_9VIRU|nr:P17 protein (TGBp3) [Indian peanut clump virus]AAO15501.1 P17 [Indian peanut clump virus H]
MEAPAITHSSGCACSDCQWSGSPFVDTRVCPDNGKVVNMTREKETTFLSVLNDNLWLFVVAVGILCVVFLSVWCETHCGACLCLSFTKNLNGVSIKVAPGAPIDPNVIAAIHHWQKYPFGENPNAKIVVSVIDSIKRGLCMLLLCVTLLLYVCYK